MMTPAHPVCFECEGVGFIPMFIVRFVRRNQLKILRLPNAWACPYCQEHLRG